MTKIYLIIHLDEGTFPEVVAAFSNKEEAKELGIKLGRSGYYFYIKEVTLDKHKGKTRDTPFMVSINLDDREKISVKSVDEFDPFDSFSDGGSISKCGEKLYYVLVVAKDRLEATEIAKREFETYKKERNLV